MFDKFVRIEYNNRYGAILKGEITLSKNMPWTDIEQKKLLVYRKLERRSWSEIAKLLNRTEEGCRNNYRRNIANGLQLLRIEKSPYPIYDAPLVMEGDTVVLPDVEIPFHKAEFVNQVLDLAEAWKITNCILAGDAVHFDSLSSWEASWITPNHQGGLTENQEIELMEWIRTLPEKFQDEAQQKIEKLGMISEDGSPNVSQELDIVRKTFKVFSECFTNIHYVLGNHCGRFLRALESPLLPDELLKLFSVDVQQWKIAPYYYSYAVSNGEKYQIEHPKGAGRMDAIKLANKHECHIIMAHSHRLSFNFSDSGNYYAIQTGHCVDENRLPYAAQRHTTRDKSLLGATIIRDGYPWLLHEKSDWEKLKKM